MKTYKSNVNNILVSDDKLTNIKVDAHIKLSKSNNNEMWDSVYDITKRIDVSCLRVDPERGVKGKCTFAYLFIDVSSSPLRL